MSRSADNILSASSVGLAVALMLPIFWAGPLVLDEHAAYWVSAADNPLSIWERAARYAAVPPFASWFQAASMAVFGETELALRLPSAIAYIGAVGLVAWGYRPSIGGLPASAAAFALAAHPDVVDEVRVGRTYGMVVLLMSLLLLLTMQWRTKDLRRRMGLFWGLTAAASVWTHILTIPVVAMSAVVILAWDIVVVRSLRPATLVGWLLAGLLCVPLVPMGERIWEWRFALNYQTGHVSLLEALGPFVWLGLPLAAVGAVAGFVNRRRRGDSAKCEGRVRSGRLSFRAAVLICLAMGLLPLLGLAAAGQGDLSSLANPRYRVPFAPANACLLAVLCCRLRPSWAMGCLVITLAASWLVVGRLPTQLVRLNTPQAPVWKQMGETLEQTVRRQGLERAPIFVQSGLIEAILIPAFPDDREFHGYVSSRLGKFYANTPNPRYALPLFWGGDNAALLSFFDRLLTETAADTPGDLFVAVATDTDVNRRSFEDFDKLLQQFGYEKSRLAGHETWAILYHYRR